MEQFIETSTEIDSGLIDEIVFKVKSQGLFDQFRRECLADVDTKPAYQNLQHRVESSVSSFLGEQTWTPQLNKNQLREKLRKLITEKGFFETGIERIVDQVVNPKMNSNFVPKIEDVAYKFLGVEKPSIDMKLTLEVDDEASMPNLDLEQVSPESEEAPSVESKSPMLLHKSIESYQMQMETDDKMDDLESPAFEPIEPSEFKIKRECSPIKQDDDMDISDGDDEPVQMNGSLVVHSDEVKSNLSSISGLTSNESNNESMNDDDNVQIKTEVIIKTEHTENAVEDVKMMPSFMNNCVAPEITLDTAEKLPQSENIISNANELIIDNLNQDSVLSQVSSTSRLSIVTNNNTNTRMDDGDGESNQMEIVTTENGTNDKKVNIRDICPYGISEEAQMQKFNESSSSGDSLVIDTDNVSNGTSQCDKKEDLMTNFDIKREEIKFEGTERKSFDIDTKLVSDEVKPLTEIYTQNVINDFKSNKIALTEVKTEKSDDLDSTNSENFQSEFNSKNASNDEKNASTLDTDDSKHIDDSNSSSSKPKDKLHDGKSSSSRNGNDSDGKHKIKDRSHHSSKDRHRGHSDKDRKSHSSSHSSRDKGKSSREESESRDGSSKYRENSSSSTKHKPDDRSKTNHSKNESHSRSSSSSKKEKDREKSKSDKNVTSTSNSNSGSSYNQSGRKDHNRHSSSSSSQKDKDSSKRDSKHSDKQKHRSDSQRSSSKKDDHFLYKEKCMPRQRSRSKDSNDGSSAHSSSQNLYSGSENNCVSQSTSNNQSANKCPTETQKIASHAIDSPQEVVSSNSNSNHKLPPVSEMRLNSASHGKFDEIEKPSSSQNDDFVLTTQPVVVDQILTGNDLNLELFIGENRDDPVVSSIEQSLEHEVRKPKFAANFNEARKLAKVRKEIDRTRQKKIEQAKVLAKKYIRTNASAVRDDSQGVELEFVCMDSSNGTKIAGPTISSPVKFMHGKDIVEPKRSTPTSTVTSSTLAQSTKESNEFECNTSAVSQSGHFSDAAGTLSYNDDSNCTDYKFLGFDPNDFSSAKTRYEMFRASLKNVSPTTKSLIISHAKNTKKLPNPFVKLDMPDPRQQQLLDMLSTDNKHLFYENNKIHDGISTSKQYNRKRKNTDTSLTEDLANSIKDDGMILASVFISQTSTECNVKPDGSNRSDADSASALEKQRQKTRYSNDDLFKPRLVLGSRSRRRGINCDD